MYWTWPNMTWPNPFNGKLHYFLSPYSLTLTQLLNNYNKWNFWSQGALSLSHFKILGDIIIYYRNILPQIMLVLSHIKDGYYFISTIKFALYILIIQFKDFIELSYFLTQYNKELPKLYREPLVSRLHPPCPLQYPLKWYSNWYRILRLFIQK